MQLLDSIPVGLKSEGGYVRIRELFPIIAALYSCLGPPRAAHAAQPCADNYSETGDASTGKTFKTVLDVKGTTADKAYVAIGRYMAKEGYLNIAVNKEIGLVSAYKELSGKKISLNVTVSAEDPVALRIEPILTSAPGLRFTTGISTWLCDLLAETLPPNEKADASQPAISLSAEGAPKVLLPLAGALRKTVFMGVRLYYFDFAGAASSIRATAKRPVLLLRSTANPSTSYVLVKCEADGDNNKRSVKLGPTGRLKGKGLSGVGDYEPDEDWILPTTSTEVQSGLWSLVPSQDLKRGEYGVWNVRDYRVALFGVD